MLLDREMTLNETLERQNAELVSREEELRQTLEELMVAKENLDNVLWHTEERRIKLDTILSKYYTDKNLLETHGKNARKNILTHYRWETLVEYFYKNIIKKI